ncbi:MAG: NADPH-dependent F420 reductase [Jatrophihabitans sp.]
MVAPDIASLRIAVIGGTGPQGRGLALRFGAAGLHVAIGSRDAARAEQAAAELADSVSGAGNADAVRDADIVIVAVPWDAHEATLAGLRDELAGKIVVDCVNPLGFDERGPHSLRPAAGSAAEQAAVLLPDSTVAAAFHHLSAVLLDDPAVDDLDIDVLVLGDDREACTLVQHLADVLPGGRGVYGGRLRNAGQVEALTANLIAINRRYKTHAGIRVTGLPTT